MKRLLLLLFTLFIVQAKAIQPATIKCIEANSVGDAIVSWQATTDVADFVSYQLYYSNNLSGPYTLLTTITTATTNSFTHIGAGADVNSCFYYIKTTGSISTGFSDTLQSIQLIVTNNNDGNAVLQWNIPSQPLPSANNWYQIYKEFPVGIWSKLDSTQTTNYLENFSICDVQVSYKIVLPGNGCINQSTPDAVHIKDLTPPETPTLDTVSINPITGEVNLGWEPALATDTKGYIIYIQQGGVWSPVDTVYGIGNTNFNYSNVDVVTSPQNYRIATMDSCMNTSPLSIDQHSLLLSYSTNNCMHTVSLSWNAYDHIVSNVAKYEIYMEVDGGGYVKIDEVTNLLNYTYSGLNNNSTYHFFIRVVANNGFTASSTVSTFLFTQTNLPSVVYFRYATVNIDQTIDLAIYVDTSATISQVLIYKQNQTNSYSLIASIPYSANGLYYASDNNVTTNKQSYNYFARIVDNCGNELLNSDTVSTILLSGTGNSDYTNFLNWLPYQRFNMPIDNYSIYRSIGESMYFDSIASTSVFTTNFTEDASPLRYDGSVFNYYVEAVESAGNAYGFKDVSRSNSIKTTQQSLTYIPNAFTPEGANPIFKPSNIFVDAKDYFFAIFTRTGAKIFETHDPNFGWNGTIDGKIVPFGIYCYKILYSNEDGTIFSKIGWVTVMR
jgi:gliding motility-associated-like protein